MDFWTPSHFLGVCPLVLQKTCVVRPVFAQVVGELQAADPSNVQGPVKQNASPGAQSEAPRRRWKPGQEQNAGQESQDSQHMLNQPRGPFPDFLIFHCAAKGGTQKGIGHFFRFRSLFGNHFVILFEVFGHFLAYPLLPSPFCGRVNLAFVLCFEDWAGFRTPDNWHLFLHFASCSLLLQYCRTAAVDLLYLARHTHG